MIYEICNPSDKYTIDCPDLEIATVVALLVGRGSYPLIPLDAQGAEIPDTQSVPHFLFGGHEEWCRESFGLSTNDLMEKVLTTRRVELAEALDSVVIGRRSLFERLAPPKHLAAYRAFREKWHDENRSSLNDIGGYCYELAAKLREKLAEPEVRR